MTDIANNLAGVGTVANKATDTVGATTTDAGVDVLGGLLHAGQGVLNVLSAPQRALAGGRNYVDENNLAGGKILTRPDDLRNMGGEMLRFATHPNLQAQTARIDRQAFVDDGVLPSDETINAHLEGFPATAARYGAQAASEIAADPMTFLPAGITTRAVRAIPGVGGAARAVADTGVGRAFSAAFNPEHNLGGLTEHGQNVVEGLRNRYEQTAEKAKRVEDQIISSARGDIKKGVVSPEISAAFKKYGATVPKGVTKPSAIMKALDEARAAKESADTRDELRLLGLLAGDVKNAPSLKLKPKPGFASADLLKNPADPASALAGVAKHIAPAVKSDNVVAKLIDKTNAGLKTMFLAVPIPHVGNLVNLAYNKYGLGPTLRGLKYAAQEATGLRGAHLSSLIDELEKAGADNQFGKLFNELGPGPIRNVERFFNAAQDNVLNPVQRGLRASMLQTEKASGRTGFDAARNIHKALGSDADTGMTKFLETLPLSQFPRFHTQTALGSFGRTLADAPGRVTGFEHLMGGPNQKPNGTPHYHSAKPTAAGLSMLQNPLSFLSGPSTLGGLADVTSPYNPIGLANAGMRAERQGKPKTARKDYTKAVQAGAQKVLPSSESLQALFELAKHKLGAAGETGAQDLLTALTGDYWSTH